MRSAPWTVDELRDAVAASTNLSEVVRRLGLRPVGRNPDSIRAWIDRLAIPTEHFVRPTVGGPRRRIPLEEVLVERSSFSRPRLKQRLYDEGLKARRCELCGQGEFWNGRQMALILDHVNGVGDDNRIGNLRIVCPNCAATLETHCGGNKRRVHEDRCCPACGSRFYPRYRDQRSCSRRCAARVRSVPRPETRRAERPPYDQLLAEVRELGFCATGRRYGVSDNAIRKWILAMEREASSGEGSPAAAGEDPPRADATGPPTIRG